MDQVIDVKWYLVKCAKGELNLLLRRDEKGRVIANMEFCRQDLKDSPYVVQVDYPVTYASVKYEVEKYLIESIDKEDIDFVLSIKQFVNTHRKKIESRIEVARRSVLYSYEKNKLIAIRDNLVILKIFKDVKEFYSDTFSIVFRFGLGRSYTTSLSYDIKFDNPYAHIGGNQHTNLPVCSWNDLQSTVKTELQVARDKHKWPDGALENIQRRVLFILEQNKDDLEHLITHLNERRTI